MAGMNFYVNGEARVSDGSSDTGISVDGVHIIINEYQDGIPTDTFGPKIFGEYQYLGFDCIIKAELIYFDIAQIQDWISGLPNSAPTAGQLGAVGSLMVGGGFTSQLKIVATPAGGLTGQALTWVFDNAMLIDANETKLGTVRSTWTLTWRAFGAYAAGSSSGVAVYTVS